MKIAVNLLPFREKIAGAGKYANQIIREIALLDSKNEYYLFITEEGKINFKISKDNFHFVTAKFNPNFFFYRIFWEQLIFPVKLKKLKPDIIFTPSVAVPFLYKGKFFTTVHDLAYKKNKSKYSFLRRFYLDFITRIAVKKSQVIFTVSKFSKKEIENEFHPEKSEILITYNGVDETFFQDVSSKRLTEFKNKYNLPENFILYVGAIEPGKNLDKLFYSFAELIKKNNDEIYLVLTSGIGWGNQSLLNLVNELKIKDKIILLPYIPENELPILYKCSKMLAYLSGYEGFGIPVLEALAAGTPVVTSKSQAVMEFSKDVVFSVDPENMDDVVKIMIKIIKDSDSIKPVIYKGKKEAEKFKWSNSAKIIVDRFSS